MAGGIMLAPLLTEMKVDLKSFKSDMDKVKVEAVGKAKEVSESMQGAAKVGEKMSNLGNSMTKYLTLPIIGAGIAAVKFGTDFQGSLAKVSTIADTSKVPIDKLKDGVLDLSNKTGMAATDLNEALYQAISGSVDTADAVDFLGVSVKAAKGGFTDTATAVDGLTTVLNSYAMESKDAEKIANQMLITQNKGKTTFGELASAVGKVTPIAAQLGITTEELFASLASTTAQGLATSESVTALKAAFSNIIKPSKEAAEMADMLGLEFNAAAIKTKGWAGFLGDVKDALKKASPEYAELSERLEKTAWKLDGLAKSGKTNTKEFKDLSKAFKHMQKDAEKLGKAADSPIQGFAQLFGSVEALNSILMLSSDNGMKIYNDTMNEMETNTNALSDAYEKMAGSPQEKFNRALEKLKNTGIEVGVKILPTVEKVVTVIGDVFEKFSSLPDPIQNSIIAFAGFTAAVGPVLSVTGKLMQNIELMSKIPGVSTVVTGALGKITGASGLTSLGIAGVAKAAGGFILTAAPWVAAAGAVAYGGYKIYESLNEDVVPEVDLFADKVTIATDKLNEWGESAEVTTVKISEGTKKAVQSYMDMDRDASSALYALKINSGKSADEIKQTLVKQFTAASNKATDISSEMRGDFLVEMTKMTKGTDKVTQEMVDGLSDKLTKMLDNSKVLTQRQKDEIVNSFRQTWDEAKIVTDQSMNDLVDKYKAMSDKLITASNERYEREKQETIDFFKENGALTEQEQANALKRMDDHHYLEIDSIGQSRKKIEDILWKAKEQNRQITQEEYDEINRIQKEGQVKAVDILSEQEAESIVIQERLKANNNRITNEMASEQIKKANETRDKTIQAAEERYEGEVKKAARLKAAKQINDEEYQKMIDKAEETRKKNVEKAEEMCEGVKQKIEDATPGIYDTVKKQTGEIKKPWVEIGKWVKNEWNWITGLLTQTPKLPNIPPTSTGWSLRTDGHKYNGLSYVPKDGYVARLHKGERVLTADENKDYTQGNTGNKGVNQTLNFYGRIDSPYEVAKASKKAMIDLSFA